MTMRAFKKYVAYILPFYLFLMLELTPPPLSRQVRVKASELKSRLLYRSELRYLLNERKSSAYPLTLIPLNMQGSMSKRMLQDKILILVHKMYMLMSFSKVQSIFYDHSLKGPEAYVRKVIGQAKSVQSNQCNGSTNFTVQSSYWGSSIIVTAAAQLTLLTHDHGLKTVGYRMWLKQTSGNIHA